MRLTRSIGLGMTFLIALALVGPASPQSPSLPTLTPELQALIKTLPHLYGPPVTDRTFERKVVLVTFFASWCHPCREEFAHLRTLYEKYHDAGVEMIAINLFENFDQLSDQKRLMAYLRLTKPPFAIVKGNETISRRFGNVTRIPTLFVFDRQGQRALHFFNAPDGRQPTIDAATLQQVLVTLL